MNLVKAPLSVVSRKIQNILTVIALLSAGFAGAQSLNISSSGQTGSSGTNWTSSGTNPVTINVTGSANIHVSVIENYLNAGTSVVVNNTNVGTIINNNISKTTGANASLTFKDIGNIKIASNVTIGSTSNALDIILWSDSDNSQAGTVMDFIYCNPGATVSSNGGKIIMAGGPDNGANGGTGSDGIPDGFAWNGSNSTDQSSNEYGGLTLGPRGGTGTVISLLSSGGDIILRGATSGSNNYPGITSQGNLKIVSGNGKIIFFGKSSTGHGIELTYGASPSIVISSSSVSAPAIDVKGTSSATGYHGFWASNNASGNILIQSTAASNGGVTIEGVNTSGTGISLGAINSGIFSQVLSQSGTITLKGQGNGNNGIMLYGDVYIGNAKDAATIQNIAPAVTTSSANILMQANEQCSFSNASGKTTRFNSTGDFNYRSYTAGFTGTVSWLGNITWTGINNITLGELAENYTFHVNTTITAANNITAFASDFALGNGAGLISTGAGTITLNAKGSFSTAGTTRRTISSVNGNINVYADSDASGHGILDIDYLTLNPGTGTTTLRAETINWTTTATTDKPYINGTGPVIIESSDASFGQALYTSWFMFDQDANSIAGLTIGKTTNTGNITHETTALNIAGPINLYGGNIFSTANLTSSATGNIFIKANNNRNGGAAIEFSASILKTAGTGTLTMQSQDRLNTGTVTASGSGVLNVVLWSDYDNDNNGGVKIDAVTTNGGHLWLGGSNSNGGSYTWNGLTVGDGPSVGSQNNNYNAIDFYGPVSTNGGQVLIWGGSGYSNGISGIGAYSGASINSGTGNIILIADNIAISDLNITSTGVLTLVPFDGAYPGNLTWNGTITSGQFNGTASTTYDALLINNFASLGGLTIGYYNGHLSSGTPVIQGNTSVIKTSLATSVAGPITIYAPTVLITSNLTSTSGGDITFYTDAFSIDAASRLTSTGNLIIAPIAAATTIGLAGGTGSLQITTTHFSTNFTDGFAEIRIGNSSAGLITLAASFTVRDDIRLTTGSNMQLNETIDIGNNNLCFIGGAIIPATNKYIKTNGTGKLIIDIANTASKLFPLGINSYHPVTITNKTGVSDSFYATASSNVYWNGGVSGTVVTWSPRVDITWNIGNSGASTGAGNVDLAFGWNAASVVGSLTDPKMMHYNGAGWEQQNGTTSFDLGAGTLNYTGYTGSFSPFGIVQSNITLPVSWLSFSGKRTRDIVTLNWATGEEENNHHFEVERKTENSSFITIGHVYASVRKNYQFTDDQPFSERSYYRIKQVDIDGRFGYSNIIAVTGSEQNDYRVSSVPGTKQLLLIAPKLLTEKASLFIYDVHGHQLMQQQVNPGNNLLSVPFGMASGIYFVKVMSGAKYVYSGQVIK